MESKTDQLAKAVGENIAAASSATLFLYVIVAVLRQSDAELILPSSMFDLGGLLDKVKDGIPGGSFVAPILQVQVPLTLFYTLGPAVLLAIHAAVVLDRKALAAASAPIRFLVIWSAPLALALIRWRFAPYVSARPTPPPVGQAMEALQTLALAADAVVVVVALLRAPVDAASPRARLRLRAMLPRAGRHAAMLWLIILLAVGFPPWRAATGPVDPATAARWAVAAVLLAGWIAEGRGRRRADRPLRQRLWFFRFIVMEDLNMIGRAGLLAIFFGLAALPSFARALDLSGETLVAHAPSDTLIQTLLADGQHETKWQSDETARTAWIGATGERIADVRDVAWHADGRGITLANWNFPGGRFDHATMALIGLSGANLRNASLDSANMIGANLSRARLQGASLRSALLEGADLSFVIATAAEQTAAPATGTASPAADAPATAADTSPCDPQKWPVNMRTDFSKADLRNANLDHADLTCANLSGITADGNTKLNSATLTGADLTGADLRKADLDGAHARFAIMTQATELDATDINGADFSHAVLRGVNFVGAKNVNKAHFDFADVRCALFPADFNSALLSTAIVTGTKLAPPLADAKALEAKTPEAKTTDAAPARSLAHATLANARQIPPAQTDAKVLQELKDACELQVPPKQ